MTGVSFASAVTTDAASAAGSASVTLSRQQRQDVALRQREKFGNGNSNKRDERKNTRRDKSSSVIIGKNVSAGVISWKGADLTVSRYIGRVAPGTTADAISSWLTSENIDVISLDAIPTKHNRFTSFKLVMKKSQLELIKERDFWPEGVIVGPWWPPKSSSTSPSTSEFQSAI